MRCSMSVFLSTFCVQEPIHTATCDCQESGKDSWAPCARWKETWWITKLQHPSLPWELPVVPSFPGRAHLYLSARGTTKMPISKSRVSKWVAVLSVRPGMRFLVGLVTYVPKGPFLASQIDNFMRGRKEKKWNTIWKYLRETEQLLVFGNYEVFLNRQLVGPKIILRLKQWKIVFILPKFVPFP